MMGQRAGGVVHLFTHPELPRRERKTPFSFPALVPSGKLVKKLHESRETVLDDSGMEDSFTNIPVDEQLIIGVHDLTVDENLRGLADSFAYPAAQPEGLVVVLQSNCTREDIGHECRITAKSIRQVSQHLDTGEGLVIEVVEEGFQGGLGFFTEAA